jgi:hypothetical protein
MDFCKILYGGILVKSVNEIQVWLKSKVREKGPTYIYDYFG